RAVGSPTYTNASLSAGTTYAFAVRARDAAGNVSASSSTATATTPAPDTTAPTVDITAPTPGATVSGPVVVNADAGDDVGVAGVQFLLDRAPLGNEDTAAPFSVSWDTTTTTNGTHVLTARARD